MSLINDALKKAQYERHDDFAGAPANGAAGEARSPRRGRPHSANSLVLLGVDYAIQTGNMVGPSHFGIKDLISLDPSAQWDSQGDSVRNSKAANWMDSPRVIKIALWDPVEVQKSGKQYIKFTNIALMFVEGQKKMQDPIIARFITYASGSATEGPGGPLIKALRLIE